MRFNKLVMQAFGTFNKETTIDFTNLNKKGLYLITGKTGSGKTTIFDAICFALYGKTSSLDTTSKQDSQKIRSNYADGDLTFVELDFEIQNKKYHIKRIPQQDNVLRNNRYVSQAHDVILTYDDEVISGVDEVNNKINSLIGLDVKMFKQVVMLPQNEFRKLLTSKTSDKEAIFRNVFSTQFLKSFQDKISADCKKKENDILLDTKELNTLIFKIDESYKELINKDNQNYEDILIDIKDKLNNKNVLLEEKKNIYNNELKKLEDLKDAYQSMQELNKNINTFNESKERLNELKNDSLIDKYRIILKKSENAKALNLAINNYNEIDKTIKELDNLNIELKEKEKELEERKNESISKRNSLKEQKDEIDSLRELKRNLEDELKRSEEKKKLWEEYLKYDEKENDTSIDNENDISNKKALEAEKEELDTKIVELKELVLDISSLYKEKENINDKLIELNDISLKLERKDELEFLIEDCALEFNRLKEESLKISDLKVDAERKRKLNIASELASELLDGFPCPVCGSKTHPSLAHKIDGITDEDIKKYYALEAQNEQSRKDIILDKQTHANNKVEIEDFLANNELVKEYSINKDNIKDVIDSFEAKKSNISNKIDHAKENNDNYYNAQERLKEVNDSIIELTNRINNFDKEKLELERAKMEKKAQFDLFSDIRDYDSIIIELNNVNEKIDAYDKSLNKCDEDERFALNELLEIGKKLSKLNEEYTSNKTKLDIYANDVNRLKSLFNNDEEYLLCLESNNDEIDKYVKDYDSTYAILENKINELSDIVKDKELIDLTDKANEIDLLKESQESLNREIIEDETLIKQMNLEIDDVNKKYNLMKDKINKKNIFKKISDLANGTLKNNTKMTFEGFVLSMYFEDVIEEANIILKKMSKNEFELVRRQNLSGAGYQGLDIDLFNTKRQSISDVSTFSGGESFMASLSLALGLSNVIRRNSSLVSIDSLFIDEGFGSLDQEETLDLAYNVLCSLKSSDRVIAIISHVSELKNRIENQIVVSKNDLGSSVVIKD